MRIAFLTNEYAYESQFDGGLGNYLRRITHLLQMRGHECEVFLTRIDNPPTGEDRDFLLDGVKIHELNRASDLDSVFDGVHVSDWLKKRLLGAWRIAEHLDYHHRSRPFEAIHATNCGFTSLFTDVKAPIFMRISSYEPVFAGAYVPEDSWEGPMAEFLERVTFLASDSQYAPSRLLADALNSELGLDVKILRSPAYLEVPPEEYDSEWVDHVTSSASKYFLFVGTVNRIKGCYVLAEALPKVLSSFSELDLHVVGREWDQPFVFGKAQLRFAGRVHYHGSQPHSRIYPLMKNALAVVIPSLVENLPNVAIEALSVGTPIIGTLGTSIEELFEFGRGGVLVPSGDAKALTEAMIGLATMSPGDRKALGWQGQQAVMQLLAPHVLVEEMEALLGSLDSKLCQVRVSREQRLRFLKKDLEYMGRLNRVYETKMAGILTSRSWRLTAPLRKIFSLMDRILSMSKRDLG